MITDIFEVFQQLEDTAACGYCGFQTNQKYVNSDETVLPDAATSSQMPFSPHDWIPTGRRECGSRQPRANTPPNKTSLGGTDPNHIPNLSYSLLPLRHRPNGEDLSRAPSQESTLPHAQPDQIKKARSYDRPGKKPAVPYRSDPLELQKHYKHRGGCDFAVDWIMVAFQNGVSLGALIRTLDPAEAEKADRSASTGFQLRQAYDGFLVKIGDRFECGLCKEGKRTHWLHKKDSVRHLRKFHFGLAERCRTWYVFILLVFDHWKHSFDFGSCYNSCKDFYSTTELRIHRCVPVAT